ncbi:tetratricopeptide repeat protein [Kitasatospora sp. NPDC050463]|uniref:tetratricopeptide repeat protein n=1 Tax=Kitasatospora sp. NPDC050463 TaxID=3155786 RepID=UPI0033D25347
MTAAVGGAAVLACAGALLALGPSGPPSSADAGRTVTAAPPPPPTDRLAAARSAVRGRPQDPYAWSELGLAELDRTRITLDAARLADADQAFQRSLALKPDANYDAVAGAGMLANARHDFAAAREAGRRATAMAPDRPIGYLVLADAEIQLGDYPAATADTQRLLDLAPTVPGYTRAAYDLETHGRPEEARIALERARQSASTPGDTAFCEHRIGDLAWDQGQVDEADEHYRRALAATPDDHYAQAGRARAAAAHGQNEEATATYRTLVEHAPQPQFLVELAELQLSQHRDADAQPQLAALAAEVRLLDTDGGPVDPTLMLYQADHGDPAVAVRLLRTEWDRRKSVLVADALGWALHRAGQDAEALGLLDQAAATGWHTASFAYHRGTVEAALGRPEAATDLRAALRLNPYFSPYHAPQARQLLASLPGGNG